MAPLLKHSLLFAFTGGHLCPSIGPFPEPAVDRHVSMEAEPSERRFSRAEVDTHKCPRSLPCLKCHG
jgi:hypothetical protein